MIEHGRAASDTTCCAAPSTSDAHGTRRDAREQCSAQNLSASSKTSIKYDVSSCSIFQRACARVCESAARALARAVTTGR